MAQPTDSFNLIDLSDPLPSLSSSTSTPSTLTMASSSSASPAAAASTSPSTAPFSGNSTPVQTQAPAKPTISSSWPPVVSSGTTSPLSQSAAPSTWSAGMLSTTSATPSSPTIVNSPQPPTASTTSAPMRQPSMVTTQIAPVPPASGSTNDQNWMNSLSPQSVPVQSPTAAGAAATGQGSGSVQSQSWPHSMVMPSPQSTSTPQSRPPLVPSSSSSSSSAAASIASVVVPAPSSSQSIQSWTPTNSASSQAVTSSTAPTSTTTTTSVPVADLIGSDVPSTSQPPTTSTTAVSASGAASTSTPSTVVTSPSPDSTSGINTPTTALASPMIPEAAVRSVHFFLSCTDIDGSSIATSSRSAQNLMRGALNMFAQVTSPRGKQPVEVNIEVRTSREMVLAEFSRNQTAMSALSTTKMFEMECSWSERKKSFYPQFSVGFHVDCHADYCDRQIQLMVMIPEENSHSNKNSQVFGYAQTSFQEMYAIAVSGNYKQTMTLPVHSTVLEGATVVVRFANVQAFRPHLFDGRHPIFRSFLFLPSTSNKEEALVASDPLGMMEQRAHAAKMAVEEAMEVDFSVTIPLQLLQLCEAELKQVCESWRHKYNLVRKKQKHFEDAKEALGFGHDVFQVHVVRARDLGGRVNTDTSTAVPTGGNGGGNGVSNRTNSISESGKNIMNRIKTSAGKWGSIGAIGIGSTSSSATSTSIAENPEVPPSGALNGGVNPLMGGNVMTASGVAAGGGFDPFPSVNPVEDMAPPASTTKESPSSNLNPFVIVRFLDSQNGMSLEEHLVGKTNTEYETASPVWSTNERVQMCGHSRPNTKFFVSASLPSRIQLVQGANVMGENLELKQFVFFREAKRSGAGNGNALSGCLRFEVYHENYAYISGVENEMLGEVTIPLQSLAEMMKVEEKDLLESEHGENAPKVTCLTVNDWFDVRSTTTDSVCGQIQLNISIFLTPLLFKDVNCGTLPIPDATDTVSSSPTAAASNTQSPGTADLLGVDDANSCDSSAPRRRGSSPLSGINLPVPATQRNGNSIELPLAFLYPHVIQLQKQVQEVSKMIELTRHLIEQKRTFKSSQHKKRADIQGIPTNLHVSYFRVYRKPFAIPVVEESTIPNSPSVGSSTSATGVDGTSLNSSNGGASSQVSTADLLGLDASSECTYDPFANTSASSAVPASFSHTGAETHSTVTCGAPTAHAMGLSEHGLREMEIEMHRLEGILEKCNPVIPASSSPTGSVAPGNRPSVLADDAAEVPFGSIPDEECIASGEASEDGNVEMESGSDIDAKGTSTSQDEVGGDGMGSPSVSPPPSEEESTNKRSSGSKKYARMAVRAVAGAKKRFPKRKLKKSTSAATTTTEGGITPSSEGAAQSGNEVKYPTLRFETEEGVDAMSSLSYAMDVTCRLEMLRSEYYLRKSVAVSQSVSSLVACFLTKLDFFLQEMLGSTGGNAQAAKCILLQWASIGFLIGWESLISSQGKELRMLSDAWVAIKCLESFCFELVNDTDGTRQVTIRRSSSGASESSTTSSSACAPSASSTSNCATYTIRVPVPSRMFALLPDSLQKGQRISITCVLFTQGINEMQSLANIVGHPGVSLQSRINSSSFRSILDYYQRYRNTPGAEVEKNLGTCPQQVLSALQKGIESENSFSKNTCILFHAADAVRSLHGGRVTYCKSGKDRTAMSVTLEQARLLVQQKRQVLQEIIENNDNDTDEGTATGTPQAVPSTSSSGVLEEVKRAANLMREYGVRMEIARKNVGRCKYSFNSIQRKLLPEIYRPPHSTIQDMVTSVTARDS